jgi:AraC family transcriptional regulator, ethanolamine operon transcriptional activator
MQGNGPEKVTFPAGSCGRLRLSGFDELASLSPGWKEQAEQVGRGRPSVDVSFAATGRFQLASLERAPGIRVRGSAGPGVSIVGLALSGSRLNAQAEELPLDRIALIPAGAEFEFICTGPHRLLLLLADARLLDGMAAERWGVPVPRERSLTLLRERGAGGTRGVASTWLRSLARAVADPAAARDAHGAHGLEQEVLGAVLDSMEPGTPPPSVRPWRVLAHRAERYMRDTIGERPDLPEICRALGTSPRSLHASFQEIFGIPPKTYQKMLRLQAARTDLVRARPGTTVSQVASRWGFQFGYFAVDYRLMFGERPSETLRRVLARKSGRVPDGIDDRSRTRAP